MSEPRRQLATIMFTDMVGYSALSQKNESLALALLEEHRQILRALFASHAGHEVDAVGDGFFVEFGSALDAARCAVAIQKALAERNATAGAERRVQVRIGLHLGDVVVQDGRVQGDGVNIAARIEPLAAPGGICLSEDVARQIQNKLDYPLRKLGKAELKNIRLPAQIYRLALPWERPQLPLLERLRFGLRRKRTRRLLLAGLSLAAVVLAVSVYTLRPQPEVSAARRLAVLPFANLSPDPQNEYFADGMTEELISRLSRIASLEVIARTSVMQYKDKPRNIADIGRELKVDTVLEGSVRKSSNKLRITAQLIRVDTQAHLWAEDYDRDLEDVFTVQSDVARHVAEALKVRLTPEEAQQVQKKGTGSLEAYDRYLQGLYHQNKLTEDGLQRSLEHFGRAIQTDPGYARAYAAMGLSYELLGEFGMQPQKIVYPKAKAAALKALELDDSSVEGYLVLAVMRIYTERDWSAAEQSFKRALALNPNSALTHDTYSILYLTPTGRHDEALAAMKRALELEPLSLLFHHDLAWVYLNAKRYDEAIEQFTKLLEREPTMAHARWGLGLAYAAVGRHEEAIAEMQKRVELADGGGYALGALGWAYGVAGQKGKALEVLAALKETAKKEAVDPMAFVWIYTSLGDKDAAFEWLDRAYAEGDNHLLMFAGVSGPKYDPLRSDPRYAALLKKLGLQDDADESQ